MAEPELTGADAGHHPASTSQSDDLLTASPLSLQVLQHELEKLRTSLSEDLSRQVQGMLVASRESPASRENTGKLEMSRENTGKPELVSPCSSRLQRTHTGRLMVGRLASEEALPCMHSTQPLEMRPTDTPLPPVTEAPSPSSAAPPPKLKRCAEPPGMLQVDLGLQPVTEGPPPRPVAPPPAPKRHAEPPGMLKADLGPPPGPSAVDPPALEPALTSSTPRTSSRSRMGSDPVHMLPGAYRGSELSKLSHLSPRYRKASMGKLAVPLMEERPPSMYTKFKWVVQACIGRPAKTPQAKALCFMDVLDVVVAMTILLNGFLLGFETNYMATNDTTTVPMTTACLEACCCMVFVAELLIKLKKYRRDLYRGESWKWNVFDTICVLLQVADVFLELIFGNSNAVVGLSTSMRNMAFARMLRMLRILRILRLVRLLRFFGELNVLTSAIAKSTRSLMGAAVMIVLLIYIVGIVFTQVSTNHRVGLAADMRPSPKELLYWWGTLFRSVLSLYESILGGADWDEVLLPLLNINNFWAVVFSLYIAFALLALLNVITGIFVECALKNAESEKDRVISLHVRELYDMTHLDEDAVVGREEFASLTMTDHELQAYLKEIGITPTEASNLFDLLDVGGKGEIAADELVSGIVRLREGAKYLDIITVLFMVEQQHRELSALVQQVELHLGGLGERLEESLGGLGERFEAQKVVGQHRAQGLDDRRTVVLLE